MSYLWLGPLTCTRTHTDPQIYDDVYVHKGQSIAWVMESSHSINLSLLYVHVSCIVL